MPKEQQDQLTELGRRLWAKIEFTGFEPDDSRSSLLRRWRGQLIAVRSDNLKVELDFSVLQGDTPLKVGQEIADAFSALEVYRTCKCTAKEVCSLHSVIEEPSSAAAAI